MYSNDAKDLDSEMTDGSIDTVELITSPSLVGFGESPILLVSDNKNALDVTLDFLVDHWPSKFQLFLVDQHGTPTLNWAQTILPHMKHIIVDASSSMNLVTSAWFGANPNAAVFELPVFASGSEHYVDGAEQGHTFQFMDLQRLVGWRYHSTIRGALEQRLLLAAK